MNLETKKQLITKLGENLPFLRKKIGLTQDELAQKIGVTRITINTIEKTKSMTWGRFTSIMMILTSDPELCRVLKQLGIFHNELAPLFSKSKTTIEDDSVASKSQFALVKQFAEYMPNAFFILAANETQEILFFNDVLVEFLGYESKEELIREVKGSFLSLCHPEDLRSVKEIQSVRDTNSKEKLYVTHRVLDKNKKVKWFDTYFKYVELEKVGPVFFTFSLDITEQITRRVFSQINRDDTKEDKLKMIKEVESSNIFKKRFEGVEILLADGDPESLKLSKQILEAEGAIVTAVENGKKAVSAAKKKSFKLILIDVIMPIVSGTQAIKQITNHYKKLNFKTLIVAMTSEQTDIFAQNNIDAGAFSFIYKPLNVTELSTIVMEYARATEDTMKFELEEAVRSANTDPLTNVKSANAFSKDKEKFNKLIQTNDTSVSFGIAVCDCDNLKGVNDTYGHSTGDIYIKNCCKIICDIFSHSPVYRIGGDEFLVIIQNKDLKEHQYLFKKLEMDLERARTIPFIEDGRASISVGFALYDRRIDTSIEETVKRADVEMYKVKKTHHEFLLSSSFIKK